MNTTAQVFLFVAFVLTCVVAKTNLTSPTPIVDEDSPPKHSNSEIETSFALLLLLGGMLLTFLFGHLIEATHFQYLHESGVATILGMAIGAVVHYSSSSARVKSIMIFDQNTFFFQLLPPIIFESGYNMKRGNFFYNIGSICLFAFVGTLVSTLVIGGLTYVVSGVLGWGGDLSLIESFLFGALISATDTVSTLAIFSALKVQKNLYADVFGESALNDAVAIIFYKTLLRFLVEEFQVITLIWAVLDFFKVFFGSLVIAVLLGLLSALIFKHIDMHKHPLLEVLLVILYAFAAYLLAEGLQLSGIVAILFVGIAMAHYTYVNLSKESQIVSKKMFKVVATICESITFIYLGLAVFSFDAHTEYPWGLIAASFPILAIARALNIFPLSFLINLCRVEDHKIPMKHQIMLWFAGLRGAMAFVLALEIETEGQPRIFSTTLVIVLFTVLVMGALTIPVLKYLQIEMGGKTAEKLSTSSDPNERKFANSSWFMKMDRTYIKPFFTRNTAPKVKHNSNNTSIMLPDTYQLSEVKTPSEVESLEEFNKPEKELLHKKRLTDNDEDDSLFKNDSNTRKRNYRAPPEEGDIYGPGIPPPTNFSLNQHDDDDKDSKMVELESTKFT